VTRLIAVQPWPRPVLAAANDTTPQNPPHALHGEGDRSKSGGGENPEHWNTPSTTGFAGDPSPRATRWDDRDPSPLFP